MQKVFVTIGTALVLLLGSAAWAEASKDCKEPHPPTENEVTDLVVSLITPHPWEPGISVVHMTNVGPKNILAWHVEWSPTADGPPHGRGFDRVGALGPVGESFETIAPGESDSWDAYGIPNWVRPTTVIYSDGTFSGDPSKALKYFVRWRNLYEDLSKWPNSLRNVKAKMAMATNETLPVKALLDQMGPYDSLNSVDGLVTLL